ncbi:MAG TPA: KilA-N domain-containing protein [Polyangiaceae bacterium]
MSDTEFMSLTNMWRNAGAQLADQPSDWMALDSTREFAVYLESQLETGLTEVRDGEIWAHWQLAFAYAKYLNPRFLLECTRIIAGERSDWQAIFYRMARRGGKT